MTSLYVKLIVRAIMNFPGSHGYSIIKNLLALPIPNSTVYELGNQTSNRLLPNRLLPTSGFTSLIKKTRSIPRDTVVRPNIILLERYI